MGEKVRYDGGHKIRLEINSGNIHLSKGQTTDKVIPNLVINGKGTVWIDDAMLSKEPLK